jgi:putative ABC transport system substrate-binding protein
LAIAAHHPGMDRRLFLVTSVAGAFAAPQAVQAQQAGKVPTIGLMGSGSAAAQRPWTTAFVQRLRALGWSEGRTVAIEYRWAEGRSDRFAEIATEFVRLKVDVIVTHNTPPTVAAKKGDDRNPNRVRHASITTTTIYAHLTTTSAGRRSPGC